MRSPKILILPLKILIFPPKVLTLRPDILILPPKVLTLPPKDLILPSKDLILPPDILLLHPKIWILPLNLNPSSRDLNPSSQGSWVLGGGGAWGHGYPPGRAPPISLAAPLHMHPGVLDNITNNQILKLFVEKNPRVLDFGGKFIKAFHYFFINLYT